MSIDKEIWFDVKVRLPEQYTDVEVKAKGETTWVSYMYPNRTWMNGDQPTHWRNIITNSKSTNDKLE